ncbi:MAG: M20/M25/M40 family metallo-hydrolase [Alphaproteobacteria bacterium]|nr:M20/M25/M40 family metallo-hydrolase [Alphaproteobacteria bacterium]
MQKALWVAAFLGLVPPAWAQTAHPPHVQLLREVYKELIEINTTDSVGDNTKAAEAMAARLKAAGFPEADLQVLGPAPRKGNLVARLRGTGARKPILLLAHLDVVEAKREDWEHDPFVLREENGLFTARGSIDDKSMAAIFVTNLIRYKQEGFVPDRDLILALTSDEEGGQHNGVRWLLDQHRALIDAAFAINEGGGGSLRNGKAFRNHVQASEKIVANFRLTTKNVGGHSSLPVKDNAITRLAAGLVRLGAFDFPVHLSEVTSLWFERVAAIESPETAAAMRAVLATPPDSDAVARLSKSAGYNAQLRTTCVATLINGGHAGNALPQTASALVNCRVLPQDSIEEVHQTLVRVLADDQIAVTMVNTPRPSPPSPLTTEFMGAVERVTAEMWPGIPVIPAMSTGATDSLYLRNAGIAAYGTSGIMVDPADYRAHGLNERVPVQSLYEGQAYLYRLVKLLASND